MAPRGDERSRIERARDLVDQLSADLDAIRDAPPGSLERRKAITRYTSTYAALGRAQVGLVTLQDLEGDAAN